MNMTNFDTFVSYDHRDKDWVFQKLKPALEEAGLNAKIDDQIVYGASIYNWIDQGLSKSKTFIIVLSNHYVHNRSFARAELADIVVRCIRGRIRLVPVYKESVNLDYLPFGLAPLLAINAGDDLGEALKKLRAQGDQGSAQTTVVPAKGPGTTGGTSLGRDGEGYIPPERRIRVQVSTECDLGCPWCHWDEFDRDIQAPNPQRVHDIMMNLKDAQEKGHNNSS